MRHKDALQTWKPESFRLRIGGNYKRIRGDEHRRHTASFKIGYVVHTARRTTASIGQGLDHDLALDGDLVAQVDWCGLGERRLAVALDVRTDLDEPLLDAVEEDVAARLGDVEQSDRQPGQRRRPCEARSSSGR
mgnify:CR=1 FL=1